MQKQIIYDNSSPTSDKEDNIAIEENDEQSLLPSHDIQLNQIPKDVPYYQILNQNDNQTNEQYDDNIETELNHNHPSSNIKNINIIETNSSKHQEHSFHNFISLNSLSKCQQCNNAFDNHHHLPFLFKCGHFFCKTCIETYFTAKTGIVCPIDGPTAKSLSDLTILDKLVAPEATTVGQTQPQQEYNSANNIMIKSGDAYCKVHQDQRLTHFVEETREIICVYCAINRMKNGNRINVKEINEKCKEYIEDVDVIIENNKHFYEMLQQIHDSCVTNKEHAINKVNALYDKLVHYLIENKNTLITKINELSNENEYTLSQKQNHVKYKIHNGNALKRELGLISNSADKFNKVSDKYNLFVRDSNDNSHQEIIVNEFNYAHCDENKLLKYLNEFGDLKSKKKTHVTYNKYSLNNNNSSHNTLARSAASSTDKNNKENNRHIRKDTNMQKVIKNYYTTGMKNEITESAATQHINTIESNSIGGSAVNTNANNHTINHGNIHNSNNRNNHNKHKHHQKQMKTVNVDNKKRPNVKDFRNVDDDEEDDFIINNNYNNVYNTNERMKILEKYTFTPKSEQTISNTHKKNY